MLNAGRFQHLICSPRKKERSCRLYYLSGNNGGGNDRIKTLT